MTGPKIDVLYKALILCLVAQCLNVSMASPAGAQDATGLWRGTWSANATARRAEHSGPLRVRLTPSGPNVYRGRFSGRFALVVPYFYRATVYQSGNTLYSSRRLGRRGQYQMRLQMYGNSLSGGWTTGQQSGGIQLRRGG